MNFIKILAAKIFPVKRQPSIRLTPEEKHSKKIARIQNDILKTKAQLAKKKRQEQRQQLIAIGLLLTRSLRVKEPHIREALINQWIGVAKTHLKVADRERAIAGLKKVGGKK